MLRGPVLINMGEVALSEIAIRHLITQQIIDGGQDRSGDRDNGLLWTAPRSQPNELGVELVVLIAGRGPGTLHQHSFEPLRAVA
jgi:hypothetical protein